MRIKARRKNRNLRIIRYIFYKETLIDPIEYFWSFIGSFLGIGIIALFQNRFLTSTDNVFLIGSFGASSVLVYGNIQSPLAQPRNLIGGHFISALVGVTVSFFFPRPIYFAAPLAVSLSIVIMQFSKTLHPPGGATALIAVIGGNSIQNLGFLYVIFPVLSGSLILLIVALCINNITKQRRYPNEKGYVWIKRIRKKNKHPK